MIDFKKLAIERHPREIKMDNDYTKFVYIVNKEEYLVCSAAGLDGDVFIFGGYELPEGHGSIKDIMFHNPSDNDVLIFDNYWLAWGYGQCLKKNGGKIHQYFA